MLLSNLFKSFQEKVINFVDAGLKIWGAYVRIMLNYLENFFP